MAVTIDTTSILESSDRRRWKLSGRLTKAGRIAYWKQFRIRTRPWQQKWRAEMRQIFEDQRIQTVAKLRRWKMSAIPEERIDDLLLGEAEWNVVLSSTGRHLGEAIMLESGKEFVKDFAIAGVSFDLDTPGVKAALDERYGNPQYGLKGTWPQQINDTTNNSLRRNLKAEFEAQLRESISVGESVSRFEARVEKVFGQAKGYRTQVIARTETLGAHNTGNDIAMRESGTPGKEWIHTTIENPREHHAEADGQIRPIDKPFVLSNGVQMMHPHAFGAPVGEVANCGCTSAPVWSRSEIDTAEQERVRATV